MNRHERIMAWLFTAFVLGLFGISALIGLVWGRR